MKKARLGVNIDHVATLRQARGEDYPSLVDAATVSLEAGADQITIHLREDRRHIQDTDVPVVKMVTDRYGVPLNLEIGANEEIVNFACTIKPTWVCLVPEKREERTTEGGLNLKSEDQFNKIKSTCDQLKSEIENVKISLFVEADLETLELCSKLNIDAVEIHTGDYAIAYNNEEDISSHLNSYQLAHDYCLSQKINFHAGHGLTDKSLMPLVEQGLFEEYNIGHWIICESVFNGLGNTVKNLKKLL